MEGRRLGNLTLVEKLGEGGMGAVYRAQDPEGHSFAVKVLPERLAGQPDLRARLLREARVLIELRHPHVVSVFDVGSDAGLDYLVLEHLEGGPLSRLLGRRWPWRDALKAVAQIAAGLEAAHQRGVVHRDVKPSNVLLARDGTAKIADFGLARLLEREPAEGIAPSLVEPPKADATALPSGASLGPAPPRDVSQPPPDLTGTGMVVGTPDYMSPEQRHGLPLDPRTDVYSLGLVLFQMLTGRLPQGLETPRDTVPDLPPFVDKLVRRMAAPLDRRIESMADVREEIARLLAGGAINVGAHRLQAAEPPPRSDGEHAFHFVTAVVMCVILSGLSFAGAPLFQRATAPPPRPAAIEPAPRAVTTPRLRLQCPPISGSADTRLVSFGGGTRILRFGPALSGGGHVLTVDGAIIARFTPDGRSDDERSVPMGSCVWRVCVVQRGPGPGDPERPALVIDVIGTRNE